MRNYVSNLARLPFGSLWKVFTKPAMVPVRLFAPSPLGPSEAAVKLVPGLSLEQAEAYRAELARTEHLSALNEAMMKVRGRPFGWRVWNEFVYILVRALRPRVMIETGVFDGHSTVLTLEALSHNDGGLLISIDLPAVETIAGSTHAMPDTTLPSGRQPGWIIPEALRDRHRLLLGDSKALLPRTLEEFPDLDIFMHDSLHTYEHMMFEYRTAWPHIRRGGLLLSDDIMWNAAFHRFSRAEGRAYTMLPGDFGGIRK